MLVLKEKSRGHLINIVYLFMIDVRLMYNTFSKPWIILHSNKLRYTKKKKMFKRRVLKITLWFGNKSKANLSFPCIESNGLITEQ